MPRRSAIPQSRVFKKNRSKNPFYYMYFITVCKFLQGVCNSLQAGENLLTQVCQYIKMQLC